MKIIFAQGNYDPKYDGTRHNVGFLVVNAWAESASAQWKEQSKFHAIIAEKMVGHEKVLLVKPTTYYNETGQSARKLVDFYKLSPEKDFLAIHDDLALPIGTIRIREKGSDAGNNGIKSLNSQLGDVYKRLRIGVMNDAHRGDDVDFVLGKFTAPERKLLEPVIEESLWLIDEFIKNNLQVTSLRV